MTFTYIPWLVTCIQCTPAQTFVNKLDHCWRLPPQLGVFGLSRLLIIEVFSIRLSEAKENRMVVVFIILDWMFISTSILNTVFILVSLRAETFVIGVVSN